MTDAELFGCFNLKRTGEGVPILPDPAGDAPPSSHELFAYHCKLNCVTDPAEVARLWAARQAAEPAKKGGKRG